MLIATIAFLTIYFSGGAGLDLHHEFEKMLKKVDDVVADEARANQARSVFEAEGQDLEEFEARVRELRGELFELDLRQDVGAEELHEAFGRLDETWVAYENQVLARREELRSIVTREEWDELHQDLAKKIRKMDESAAKSREKAKN